MPCSRNLCTPTVSASVPVALDEQFVSIAHLTQVVELTVRISEIPVFEKSVDTVSNSRQLAMSSRVRRDSEGNGHEKFWQKIKKFQLID